MKGRSNCSFPALSDVERLLARTLGNIPLLEAGARYALM
jgi:hypothetical protein